MKKLGVPSLKEVIAEGLRPRLEDEVIRMAKIINQRFYRLEKNNLQKGSYAYKQAAAELGKNKPRYVTGKDKIAKTPLDRLYRTYIELYNKHYSDTSLVAGVKRINQKRIQTAVDRINDIIIRRNGQIGEVGKISEADFIEFLDNGGAELLNSKYIDSDQLIEDWIEATKNGNVSTKEFLREFKRFKNQKINYGQAIRNIAKLRERKKRRGK